MVGGVVSAVGLGSLASASAVSAATSPNNDTIVDKLASKFNLNKEEVKQVFEDERKAHMAEREARVADKLQALVDNKTITAEQKTAIEAKLTELKSKHQANRDAMKDMTPEERKAKFDAERSALEAWAKDQGLDLSKLKGIFMSERGHGREHGKH
ncbi:MAG: hypothetical protein QG553_254 [Patescibacteria group bacterium]|nr:hypothetical protein [Patescibacteria group bacterium]